MSPQKHTSKEAISNAQQIVGAKVAFMSSWGLKGSSLDLTFIRPKHG